ncbi:MAG TPA: UbiD family decarboxylase, partial [Dehalococcoidia bacterium]|nr:UbiD family decarboxylase [Dehalococcoidia bacterium]
MRLRDYISRLQELDLLSVVDAEVDWNLEMAAIDTMLGRLGGPAILFTNVRGYPGCSSVVRHFTGTWERPWRNCALVLGLPSETSWSELLDELWRRFQAPLRPTLVSTGPCKENKAFGKDVDLFKLPWPFIHQGDGGRYLTLSTTVTKSMNIDWTNWGNYRYQVQTKTRMSCLVNMYGHMGYMYYQEYERNNLPMPACIVLGGPVEETLIACTKIPFGVSEADWVGALAQEPVELVKAETNDLLVPAHAEVVIEGEWRPYERMDEGPFGEFFGYMHGPRIPRPVFRAHCITWRSNPIIPGLLAEGMPGAGSLFGIGRLPAGYQFAIVMKALGAYARHLTAKNGFLPGIML